MAKSVPFEIHVDPSCIAEEMAKQSNMPAERVASNETVVRHESWGEEEVEDAEAQQTADMPAADVDNTKGETTHKNEDEARERRIEKIQAEIRAAARAVVASVEQEDYAHEDSRLSTQADGSSTHHGHEEENDTNYANGADLSYESDHDRHSERAGDSSSQHDADIDDDVFSQSNRSSNRSSLNSCDDLENHKLLVSPVVGEEAASGNESVSRIPSISSYARPEFDHERTPSKILSRPPFRTPSSVRAMQMSSPTQSIYGSPRSAKRHMPTVSRLGTPTSHTSPTKRTPTRFKTKKEYPLVLLHVTVLPLHWNYSRLMSSEVPDSLQHVRDSWRLLQEKLGDTVLERGILLAHPQDSYEVLEERLLEALELPVRPRAQILRCGHYMGPSDSESPSSDEEVGGSWVVERKDGRSWCDICARNVRLEELGSTGDLDKKFRIKVYASNGLMRAGAWAAAWKEMERVDVELEPYVEAGLHAELELLDSATPLEAPGIVHDEDDGFVDEDPVLEQAAPDEFEGSVHEHEQDIRESMAEETLGDDKDCAGSRMAEAEELQQKMADEEHLRQRRVAEEEEMRQRIEREEREKINQMAEELGIRQRRSEEDQMRKLAEEERAREIYGQPQHHAPSSEIRQRQREEDQRRELAEEERTRDLYGQPQHHARSPQHTSRGSVRGDESLSELLLAAFQVAMRDGRNIAIAFLSVLVLFMALKPSSKSSSSFHSFDMPDIDSAFMPQVTTTVTMEVPLPTLGTSTEPVLDSASASTATQLSSGVTIEVPQVTAIYKEKTVTEMVPVATMTAQLSLDINLDDSDEQEVVEQVSKAPLITQITTTIYQERTVTKLVPLPTTAGVDQAAVPTEDIVFEETSESDIDVSSADEILDDVVLAEALVSEPSSVDEMLDDVVFADALVSESSSVDEVLDVVVAEALASESSAETEAEDASDVLDEE